MTELFTDYKNRAFGLAQSLYGLRIEDHEMPDALRILRRCHTQNIPCDNAADLAASLFGPPFPFTGSERYDLTEAGEAALEMNSELKAIDNSLGIPRSSPSSAPPPVDPVEDDVLFAKAGGGAAAHEETKSGTAGGAMGFEEKKPAKAAHHEKKVPRK